MHEFSHCRWWPRLYHVGRDAGEPFLDHCFNLAHDEQPLFPERLDVVLVQFEDAPCHEFLDGIGRPAGNQPGEPLGGRIQWLGAQDGSRGPTTR